jgi:hypothetical protein
MTKDYIMALAREAGMHDPMIFLGAYERFANSVYALAAATERDACKEICVANGALGLAAAIRARETT